MYEWFYENPKKMTDIKIVQERWIRENDKVIINKSDMMYQVNPEVRYNWHGDISYPIKLLNGKIIKYEYDGTEFTQLGNKTSFDDKQVLNYGCYYSGLYSSMPLSMKGLSGDITISYIKNMKNNIGKVLTNATFFTSFIRCKNTKNIYKRTKDKNYNYKYFKYENYKVMDEVTINKDFEYEELVFIPQNDATPHIEKNECKKLYDEIVKFLFSQY